MRRAFPEQRGSRGAAGKAAAPRRRAGSAARGPGSHQPPLRSRISVRGSLLPGEQRVPQQGGAMGFFSLFLIYDVRLFSCQAVNPPNPKSNCTNLQSPSNLLPLGVCNPSETQTCIFSLLWDEFFLDLQPQQLSSPSPKLIHNLLITTPQLLSPCPADTS